MEMLDNNLSNQTPPSYQSTVIRWALIGGGLSFGLTLLTNLIGLNKSIGLSFVLGFGAYLAILVLGVKEYRELSGGFIPYGRAFLVAFLIAAISTVISVVLNYIYMNFLNPAAIETQLEMSRSIIEKFGLPEEAVEKSMEEAEKSLRSPMSIVSGAIGGSIMGGIVSAIVAAVMKKDRPFS
jgi:hypothetical protein